MDNPYAASAADPSLQTQGTVTPAMIQALQGTKPWVRFCSILGFIFTGLIFLGLALLAAIPPSLRISRQGIVDSLGHA